MDPFHDYPVYNGADLGVEYSASKTIFKVWAPKASEVKLRLYVAGEGGEPLTTIGMNKAAKGVWKTIIRGDIKNRYYTFQVCHEGGWLLERPDIYAKAVGVNGLRGMVIDLKE